MRRGLLAAGASIALHLGVVLAWPRAAPVAPALAQPPPVQVEVTRLAGLVPRRARASAEPPAVRVERRPVVAPAPAPAPAEAAAAVAAGGPEAQPEPEPEPGSRPGTGAGGESPVGGGAAGAAEERTETGGEAAPLDTAALSRRLQQVALRCYPAAARRFRQEGDAQVRFCLDAAGAVRESTIADSSGSALLDHAASRCVVPGAAPFEPQTFGRCFTLPVRFRP